jgi:hypothetical protein
MPWPWNGFPPLPPSPPARSPLKMRTWAGGMAEFGVGRREQIRHVLARAARSENTCFRNTSVLQFALALPLQAAAGDQGHLNFGDGSVRRYTMTTIRILLFANAVLTLASPALAGDQYHRWPHRYVDAPWSWVCGAFEYRHKCNAEFNVRTNRCGCLER